MYLEVSRATPLPPGTGAGAGQPAAATRQVVTTTHGRLNFVDLAGSERLKASGYRKVRETACINRSLYTLGKVITALAGKGATAAENGGGGHQQPHVPFRDSSLTKVLVGSLAGNSFTAMVGCVSPSLSSLSESLRTLEFSMRVSGVTNFPLVNESSAAASSFGLSSGPGGSLIGGADEVVGKLRREVEELRRENRKLWAIVDDRSPVGGRPAAKGWAGVGGLAETAPMPVALPSSFGREARAEAEADDAAALPGDTTNLPPLFGSSLPHIGVVPTGSSKAPPAERPRGGGVLAAAREEDGDGDPLAAAKRKMDSNAKMLEVLQETLAAARSAADREGGVAVDFELKEIESEIEDLTMEMQLSRQLQDMGLNFDDDDDDCTEEAAAFDDTIEESERMKEGQLHAMLLQAMGGGGASIMSKNLQDDEKKKERELQALLIRTVGVGAHGSSGGVEAGSEWRKMWESQLKEMSDGEQNYDEETSFTSPRSNSFESVTLPSLYSGNNNWEPAATNGPGVTQRQQQQQRARGGRSPKKNGDKKRSKAFPAVGKTTYPSKTRQAQQGGGGRFF